MNLSQREKDELFKYLEDIHEMLAKVARHLDPKFSPPASPKLGRLLENPAVRK